MPEAVELLHDGQIIHVRSYGEVTIDELRASLADVKRIREERGVNRLLVDASEETSLPSTMPVYDFGVDLSETLRGMTIALVKSPATTSALHFLESVVLNRGVALRTFESVEPALAWLLTRASSRNETVVG
jgi:hypothetical protein